MFDFFTFLRELRVFTSFGQIFFFEKLQRLRFIIEHTAAVIAYNLNNKTDDHRYALIFDLSGGTCGVSILSINDYTIFEVKSTAEDTWGVKISPT